MTHDRRIDRLRVEAPTLEPDPAFLGMLTHLSASSYPAVHRSARSAGLRAVLATAAVAAIAAATWAAGVPTGGETPYSPADAPTQQEPSGPPSPGDVGTPHSDVATSPGSPLSPGLPGSPSSASEHASDPAGRSDQPGRGKGPQGTPPGKAKGHAKDLGKGYGQGHGQGHGKGHGKREAKGHHDGGAQDRRNGDGDRTDQGDQGDQVDQGDRTDPAGSGEQRGNRGLIGQ
ncbi:hypothetical protein GCM10022237_03940 [Nocardioides ginsengisoli]|uniref:Uncharacterized protein n=1 Tax=Nocardioides ginsengisoli TaxID=363868 RepID=A0ABW3VY12_9ACTN